MSTHNIQFQDKVRKISLNCPKYIDKMEIRRFPKGLKQVRNSHSKQAIGV